MTFWEGFYSLPVWFVICFLSVSLLGVFFILFELSNRKLKIDKTGIAFDRMRDKKPFLVKWREAKTFNRRKEDKIPLSDVNPR